MNKKQRTMPSENVSFLQSIRAKLILASVAIVLIPVSVMFLASLNLFRDFIEGQFEDKVHDKAFIVSTEYDRKAEELRGLVRSVALNRAVTVLTPLELRHRLAEYLSGSLKESQVDTLTVVDAKGDVVVRVGNVEAFGDSQAADEIVREALNGKFVSGTENVLLKDLLDQDRVLRLKEMFPSSQKTRKVMVIKAAAPIHSDVNNAVIGAVIAGCVVNGNVVITNNISKVVDAFVIYQGDEVVLTNMDGVERKSLMGEKMPPGILKKLQDNEVFSTRTVLGEKDYIAGYIPLQGTDRKVVGALAAAIDIQAIREMNQSVVGVMLLITLAGIVFAIILNILISRSLTRPIAELRDKIKIVGDGDLDYRVGTSANDEIGQLSRAFDQMTEDLKKVITSRDELNAEIAVRKQAEAALRESRQQSADIIDFLPDATFVVDIHGKVIAWNKAMEHLSGVKAVDMLGKGDQEYAMPFYGRRRAILVDLVLNPGLLATSTHYKAIKKEKDHLISEVFLPSLKGSGAFIWGKAAPLYDTHGHMIGAIETMRDITERRKAEEELQRAYQDLQSAQSRLLQSEKMASIGQLAAGVAHEINNPTAFVASNLEMLKTYLSSLDKVIKKYRDWEEVMRGVALPQGDAFLHEIQELRGQQRFDVITSELPGMLEESLDGVLRIKKIVSSLLSFAHADSGERQEIDIHDAIETALKIAHNEIKFKVEVVREYGDIPRLSCYPQLMSQVFLNLIVNAAQAIVDKGKITIRTYADNTDVFIDVADTGCGMTEQVQAHLFEPFFTTKPVGKGTGLGLSLVYNVVNKHGGIIVVHSKAGEGTRFTIRIPRSVAS